jgi:hypothetical protein
MAEIMILKFTFIVLATVVIFHGFKIICIMDNPYSWRKCGAILVIAALAFLGYAAIVDFELPRRDIYLMLIALVAGILLWHLKDRRPLT